MVTIQEVMEEDEYEEMWEEKEEEDEQQMSESRYIGAKGPMVRTSLEGINGCANTHWHGFARSTRI